jgi:hypothetical protein
MFRLTVIVNKTGQMIEIEGDHDSERVVLLDVTVTLEDSGVSTCSIVL